MPNSLPPAAGKRFLHFKCVPLGRHEKRRAGAIRPCADDALPLERGTQSCVPGTSASRHEEQRARRPQDRSLQAKGAVRAGAEECSALARGRGACRLRSLRAYSGDARLGCARHPRRGDRGRRARRERRGPGAPLLRGARGGPTVRRRARAVLQPHPRWRVVAAAAAPLPTGAGAPKRLGRAAARGRRARAAPTTRAAPASGPDCSRRAGVLKRRELVHRWVAVAPRRPVAFLLYG